MSLRFAVAMLIGLMFTAPAFGQTHRRTKAQRTLIRPLSFTVNWNDEEPRAVGETSKPDGRHPVESRPAQAQGAEAESPKGDKDDKGDDDDKEKKSYGPPPDEPRKTLFQWSYGTSFGGGIDEDDELQTDRPDFTEASTAVGNGVLQIESGYTYVRNKDAGNNSILHSAGEVLIRYGIFEDWLEFRIGAAPFVLTSGGTSVSGVEDLYLGFKIGLTPQEGLWPEMALVPQMTVPSGHQTVTSGRVLAGMNWLYGWDVNDFIAIGGSTQFNSSTDGGTGLVYTEWAQSLTVNYNLTKKLGAYTEWFALFPHGADTEQTQHYLDGGFAYRFTPNLQADIRAGYGLSSAADDYFVGTGLSIRFR